MLDPDDNNFWFKSLAKIPHKLTPEQTHLKLYCKIMFLLMYGILSIINIVKLAETLAFLSADSASWGNQVFEATPRNIYIFFCVCFLHFGEVYGTTSSTSNFWFSLFLGVQTLPGQLLFVFFLFIFFPLVFLCFFFFIFYFSSHYSRTFRLQTEYALDYQKTNLLFKQISVH